MLAIGFTLVLLSLASAQDTDTITRTRISATEAAALTNAVLSHARNFVYELPLNDDEVPYPSNQALVRTFDLALQGGTLIARPEFRQAFQPAFQPASFGMDRNAINADTPGNDVRNRARMIERNLEFEMNERLYTKFWQGEISTINKVLASPVISDNLQPTSISSHSTGIDFQVTSDSPEPAGEDSEVADEDTQTAGEDSQATNDNSTATSSDFAASTHVRLSVAAMAGVVAGMVML